MASPVLLMKAAALLINKKTRKAVGWIIAAILSPLILLLAFLFVLAAGAAEHNLAAVQMCFFNGDFPEDTPAEYQAYIEEMRESLALLEGHISDINGQIENGTSLDDIRVKAIFFTLYFGSENPSQINHQKFVDCFVTYGEQTHTVTTKDEDGNEEETEESYTVAVPIEDITQIYQNIQSAMGIEITADQQANAESIYNLIRTGSVEGVGGGNAFAGADEPYIGVDGFCSPVGENWRDIVTSEFGNRIDPITGERAGHTGMDLAVPTWTCIRAALDGTVTVSEYNRSYGYYIVIDHGNGLSTLYAHNSQLFFKVGETVKAGDIISLSGSTGRSTGPHLHFEVRVNGERTNPRYYLP